MTRAEVQARIDEAVASLEKATTAPATMISRHGADPAAWPNGPLRTGFLGIADARADVGQLADPAPPPPPPPPPSPGGTGLALIAYGGTLPKRPHLTDGTYDVVVADWASAGLLATVSGKGYAYTVTTTGVANTGVYVILDPLGNSGLTGALKPDDYIAKCAALKAAHPGLHGIFLDNNVPLGKTLSPPVPEAELVAILAHVSAGLKAHGLGWLSNTGWYVSGDAGDNDGSLWRRWATEIADSFDYLLLENWQQASSHTPKVRRLRGTDAWYKHWDDFQKCVGAVPGKFMGASYSWGGDQMFGTYGRASMLTAPGADPRNVFFSSIDYLTDPTGQPWTKPNPNPTVDPVAGTATL